MLTVDSVLVLTVGSVLVETVLVVSVGEEEFTLRFFNLLSFFCTLIPVILLDIR